MSTRLNTGHEREAGADIGAGGLGALPEHVMRGHVTVRMAYLATGTLPNIRNTLNKKSTRHSGPRKAANGYE